jgi:hypothetical protein
LQHFLLIVFAAAMTVVAPLLLPMTAYYLNLLMQASTYAVAVLDSIILSFGFPPVFWRFDGAVVCFRVYLKQPALALELTKPALQLLVVHVLKGIKQLLASHRLMLRNPGQQLGFSSPLHLVLPSRFILLNSANIAGRSFCG